LASKIGREPMLDMFIFETLQQLEELEQIVISSEKTNGLTESAISEIFRIMHTIKGSSAMMLFNNITSLSHSIEDLFYFIRNDKPQNLDNSELADKVLESVDFIKVEMNKISNDEDVDGDAMSLIEDIKMFLAQLKKDNPAVKIQDEIQIIKKETSQKYYITQSKIQPLVEKNTFKAIILYQSGCEMENIRAFTLIHNLKELTDEIWYNPSDIIDNDSSVDIIKRDGFRVLFKCEKTVREMNSFFEQIPFIEKLELEEVSYEDEIDQFLEKRKIVLEDSIFNIEKAEKNKDSATERDIQIGSTGQSIISVNISKLDKLMDLVGELVISEAMVTQNPDLRNLVLDNFQKSARQLKKITTELQDVVMSIRMVPISTTFLKMNRIVRDMSKRLDKEVKLQLIGEETEVDKNIIDHISDPLMHLIRNSIDHGLESTTKRVASGKSETGVITLEAKNAGGDVLIQVKDDGAGLDREKILKIARSKGLFNKPEKELTDKEVYSFIFLPGFSTNDKVTEFSGRGVGMDVVVKNIQNVGGSVSIDSTPNVGTTITLKIPLTLAIIDGMTIRVGKSRYTIPITNIRESIKVEENSVIKDPNGNEMVFIKEQCYPILRLHRHFKVNTNITDITKGIIIKVEVDDKALCIFADELVGEQLVVVKALPKYIKKIKGVEGCTLMGDGGISLILDIPGFLNNQ